MRNIHQLQICRFGAGVQLLDKSSAFAKNKNCLDVKDLLQLPLNVYFINDQSQVQLCNPSTLAAIAMPLSDIVGKDPSYYQPKFYAQQLIYNDRVVVNTQSIRITDEPALRNDEVFNYLTFKMPLYAQNSALLGVFGFSIELNPKQMADSILMILQTGLLPLESKNFFSSQTLNYQPFQNVFLSPREKNILQLLIRGFTAKMVANNLGISYRTVETHLANLKHKLKVKSKAELIDKTIDYF